MRFDAVLHDAELPAAGNDSNRNGMMAAPTAVDLDTLDCIFHFCLFCIIQRSLNPLRDSLLLYPNGHLSPDCYRPQYILFS